MPRYRDFKNAILKDDYFSQELKGRDELLQRWFWAGVAAAVRVEEKVGNVGKPNSNVVLADMRAIIDNLYEKRTDDMYTQALDDIKEKLSKHFA